MAFVKRKASSSKPPPGSSSRRSSKPAADKVESNAQRRVKLNDELKELQQRVDNYVPTASVKTFSEIPLSSRTLKGLNSSHFLNPTPIQAQAMPPALTSRDLLGSAKTGSGKTLAFLIPLLERLYLLKWGPLDGLGAVVISPTRELAVQTFAQLRDIGKYHSFSAGLVIGGKPLKEERDRLGRMNILIATPGRLLQHLDSTVGFESAGLKVLVLDEADRLLDLGFLPALKAIVSHFSPAQGGRQTMLFSATQSKDLAALAKLSLHDPLYINCNKPGEEGVLPSQLEQFYSIVPLDRKLDVLWGFVKSHLKMKGVVFVTTGKQVRFIFETFRRLHPGLPLVHLHGKQKQATRLSIFQKFSSSKHALLICTDIAARGLDFPAVDWVIQLDCPEDVDTYIHRVGRTARYQSGGKALLFLLPSEQEGMETRWKEKSIEPRKMKIKESAMGNLKQQMQNFAFREPDIKYLGQRAFISYMRSVHLQKDKTVFKVAELPAEGYAASMGLPGAPQIRLGNESKATKVRTVRVPVVEAEEDGDVIELVASDVEESEEEGTEDDDEVKSSGSADNVDQESQRSDTPPLAEEGISDERDDPVGENPHIAAAARTKYDRMFERKNQSILTPHYTALIGQEIDYEEADVFTLARRDHDLEVEFDNDLADIDQPQTRPKSKPQGQTLVNSDDLSKRKLKAAASRKGQLKDRPTAERLIFDDEGQARDFYAEGEEAERGAAGQRDDFVSLERERMRMADKEDRAAARELKRERKRKRKDREKEALARDDEAEEGTAAFIGGGNHEAEEMSEPEDVARMSKPKRPRVAIEDEEDLALRLLGERGSGA